MNTYMYICKYVYGNLYINSIGSAFPTGRERIGKRLNSQKSEMMRGIYARIFAFLFTCASTYVTTCLYIYIYIYVCKDIVCMNVSIDM
jgi:hypothetical protein